MNMDDMKSITEVCRLLDMTSRTVRYYEQCGLIKTARSSPTAPRSLDKENIERLRKIRFLRKLGLSIDEIKSVIDSDEAATEMIRDKTVAFQAEIASLIERICLLETVLDAASMGENIYSVEKEGQKPFGNAEDIHAAEETARLLVEGRFTELKQYFGYETKKFTTDFIKSCWEMHIEPCGNFISYGETVVDGSTIIKRLNYEKIVVAIKMEVYGGKVMRLMLQYFNE